MGSITLGWIWLNVECNIYPKKKPHQKCFIYKILNIWPRSKATKFKTVIISQLTVKVLVSRVILYIWITWGWAGVEKLILIKKCCYIVNLLNLNPFNKFKILWNNTYNVSNTPIKFQKTHVHVPLLNLKRICAKSEYIMIHTWIHKLLVYTTCSITDKCHVNSSLFS